MEYTIQPQIFRISYFKSNRDYMFVAIPKDSKSICMVVHPNLNFQPAIHLVCETNGIDPDGNSAKVPIVNLIPIPSIKSRIVYRLGEMDYEQKFTFFVETSYTRYRTILEDIASKHGVLDLIKKYKDVDDSFLTEILASNPGYLDEYEKFHQQIDFDINTIVEKHFGKLNGDILIIEI